MSFKKKTPWPPKGKCKMDALSIYKFKKKREKNTRLRVKLCRKLLKIY